MGWLKRADERNQYAANWLMDHPDAGTQMFPLAKSRRARKLLVAVFVAAFVAGMIFGLLGALVGFTVFLVTALRVQHNPVRERYQRGGAPPDR